jgi:hypothetical protein
MDLKTETLLDSFGVKCCCKIADTPEYKRILESIKMKEYYGYCVSRGMLYVLCDTGIYGYIDSSNTCYYNSTIYDNHRNTKGID